MGLVDGVSVVDSDTQSAIIAVTEVITGKGKMEFPSIRL